jgi:hypothetical protein
MFLLSVFNKTMKKLIILGLLLSFPSSAFAASFLTTPYEYLTEVKDNREKILKLQEKNYCREWPKRDQVELDRLNTISTKPEEITDRIDFLVSQKNFYRIQCDQATRDFVSLSSFRAENKTNLSCGSGYIKRGEICITPTEACEFYFGNNISGQVDNSAINTATCVCNDGYKLEDNKCVVKPVSQTASIASANTLELQKIIASLLAQVQDLMAQLNARR